MVSHLERGILAGSRAVPAICGLLGIDLPQVGGGAAPRPRKNGKNSAADEAAFARWDAAGRALHAHDAQWFARMLGLAERSARAADDQRGQAGSA